MEFPYSFFTFTFAKKERMNETIEATGKNNEFKKSLNLFDATMIVMGSMIGSGIFIVSADMSRILGAPGWLLVAWIITGVMTIFAALSYGELAGMMPKAGGIYIYLREAFGPLFGFLYGWTGFMVIQSGTIAAVAMAFAKYFGVIQPWISEENIILKMGNFGFNTTQLVAIILIVVLSYINSRGMVLGKFIQNLFTNIKFIVLLAFIVVGLFIARNEMAIKSNLEIFWQAQQVKDGVAVSLTGFSLVAAIGVAMVGSLFTVDSWYSVTFTGAEIINPKKNIPRSLVLGSGLVIILFILTNMVYLLILPLRGDAAAADVLGQGIQYAVKDRVATAAISDLFGTNAAMIMAIFIIISSFGCNNGIIMTSSRVYYAMAKDGLFFKSVGTLNKHNVPGRGLFAICVWSSLLCLSGSYSQLLDYVVFAVLIFFVLTIAGIFVLRHKKPDAERPVKAFGYPFIPALYIIFTIFLLADLLYTKPEYTGSGLIIVLIGFPIFYVWRLVNKSKED
jgi:APA family basic amino acid/polyamine antiporter